MYVSQTICCIASTYTVKVKSLSRVRLFVTPWTAACQTPPRMGFSRQEYWSGSPFPSPGDLPDPGIEPWSPAPQADSLLSELPGKPSAYTVRDVNYISTKLEGKKNRTKVKFTFDLQSKASDLQGSSPWGGKFKKRNRSENDTGDRVSGRKHYFCSLIFNTVLFEGVQHMVWLTCILKWSQ